MLTQRKEPRQRLTRATSVPGSRDVNESRMMDGSRKCFQALWFYKSIDLFWDATLKEVILIAHGAVLHHSLSVIYWSKYLRASLSNDISALICLPFRPAALYLFGSGADPAARLWKRSALSLHLKRLYWTLLPRTSIFQLRRVADVMCADVFACLCTTECAGDCVHSQMAASFFSEVHRVRARNCS